ncbi:MAG: IclR family transcriptional regulator [Burkholderiaceae bacterium]
MARLDRILSLLDSFGGGTPVATAEQLSARTGLPIATTYRYIRELSDAGLLVRLPRGYAPGPRIIEWDCMVRSHDPLLAESREVIRELVADTGLELLLSQLYGDKIVNVHYEHSAGNAPLELGRGRVMPLFRGSTSRVILASMRSRQLRRLYDAHANDPDVLRIGGDWRAFSRAMADVRKQGSAMTIGELRHRNVGIAAPIFGDANHVLGSLTLISGEARFRMFREDYLHERVIDAAKRITGRLAASENGAQPSVRHDGLGDAPVLAALSASK